MRIARQTSIACSAPWRTTPAATSSARDQRRGGAQRRRSIEAGRASDAPYLDPQYSAEGHDGLEALAAGFHTMFPGHQFQLAGPIDSHHDRAQWAWRLVAADGTSEVLTGVD